VTVVLQNSLVTLLEHRNPETLTILVPLECLIAFFSHVFVVILLVQKQGSSSQLHILKDLLQVDERRTNNVIRLEEISVECLNREIIMGSWVFSLEVQSVVEGSCTGLAPIMSVGLEGVLS
jgi:hypothetical protein